MLRSVAVLAAAFTLTTALAVEARAADPVTINFWKPPNTDSSAEEALWAKVIKDFEAANPDITVKYTQVPWDQLDTQFTAGFAGSSAPDVFYLPDEFYPKYAAAGQILPLDHSYDALASNYNSAIWKGGIYEGQLYGIPFLTSNKAIIVNKTMLSALGLLEPKTWDDIDKIAKAATDTSAGTYGFYVADSAYYPALIGAAGSSLISSDLTQAVTNPDAATAALKAGAADIAATGGVVPLSLSQDQARDLLDKGKVAIAWIDVSLLKDIRAASPSLDLDVMAVPKVDGTAGRPTTFSATGYMMVGKNSKYPDAALKFLQFTSSADVQRNYVVEGTQNFSPMNGIPASAKDPLLQHFADLLKDSIPITPSVNWSQAKDVLQTSAEAVLSGQSSAADGVASATAQIGDFLNGK